MGRKVTKAIFPVAGLGTRFLPTTKSIPKEMLSLVDKPLIQYAIDEARAAGIKEFIFVTSRGKGSLEDYFDHAHELESSLKKSGKTEIIIPTAAENAAMRKAMEPLYQDMASRVGKQLIDDVVKATHGVTN